MSMRRAMPDLDRLARYERRAWSRWKRAIRDFIKIKSTNDGWHPNVGNRDGIFPPSNGVYRRRP